MLGVLNNEGTQRVVNLGTNKIKMTQTDPFGLIKITFDKGEPPQKLQGLYTSFSAAELEVRKYLETKRRKEVKPGSSIAKVG